MKKAVKMAECAIIDELCLQSHGGVITAESNEGMSKPYATETVRTCAVFTVAPRRAPSASPDTAHADAALTAWDCVTVTACAAPNANASNATIIPNNTAIKFLFFVIAVSSL